MVVRCTSSGPSQLSLHLLTSPVCTGLPLLMSTTLEAADAPSACTASPHHHVGLDGEQGSCSVRFDAQCVVIPELPPRSRRTRLVTKTYSVPLWKRRGSLSGPQPASPDPDEDDHVILKLPLPRCVQNTVQLSYDLIVYFWHSLQTRVQSPTRSGEAVPLTPCLVHRSPEINSTNSTASPTTVRRNLRKSSVSSIHADLVTVPLRPCCAACQEITDAARLQGDAWTERFSRAAKYRRSLSADSQPRTITVAGSAAAASFGSLARGVPISVDEVDKRRRSVDNGLVSGTSDLACLNDTVLAQERRDRCSEAPNPPSRACVPLPSPIRPPQLVTHNIPEETFDDDDAQLFPLPSPKRTPCSSAAPSPTASLSSLQNGQLHRNSSNSPALSNCSGEFLAHGPRQFLAPPPGASTSSLSLPRTSECSYSNLTEDPPRASSPNILASLPPLSGRQQAWCTSPTSSQGDFLEKIPQPIPSNSSRSPQPSAPIRIPSASTSTLTRSPSTSPSMSPNTRRILRSFSAGSPRQMISGVIRSVNVIGGRGGGAFGM